MWCHVLEMSYIMQRRENAKIIDKFIWDIKNKSDSNKIKFYVGNILE